MNQFQIIQIAQSLGIELITIKWIFFIFIFFTLIMLFLNVLEKLGTIDWLSKWITPKTNYQEEIDTLILLKDFKAKNELNNDDYPYSHIAHQQQELTLLNRFYETRIEDYIYSDIACREQNENVLFVYLKILCSLFS